MIINSYFLYRDDVKKDFAVTAIEHDEENANAYFIKRKITCAEIKYEHSYSFTLLKDSCVDIRLRMEFSFENAEEIVSVKNDFQHLTFKTLSPFYLRIITERRFFLLHNSRSYAYKIISWNKQKLILDFLIDAPFLHPSWDYQKPQRVSTAMPVQLSGTAYHFNINIHEEKNCEAFIPVQQFMYPLAHSAAFILTDHCDFDTEEKLTLFLNGNNNDGWLNRGLKISKGVFTIGPKKNEPKKNASLEDENYKKLIDDLFEDGSEIVPHALKSKGQLSSEEFHAALKKLNDLFHPQTWIDHGRYLKYCYSQGAAANPDYLLADTLQKINYNNLWAFHDVNLEANDTLNICRTSSRFPFRVLSLSFKYFFTAKWLVGAHYLRSIIHRNYSKNIFTEYIMYVMGNSKPIFINLKNRNHTFIKDCGNFIKKLFKFKSFKNNVPVPYDSKEVLKYCSPLYLESRKPLSQYHGKELLMFYTFETTHLTDIYNRNALDDLIAEYGLHIGHTYILNDLPYINSIFKKKKGKYVLAEKWIKFLDVLAKYVSEINIWNPNMNEYAAYVIALQNVKIVYKEKNKIELMNNNAETIKDYTLVVPACFTPSLVINNVKAEAFRSDANYHFFVMNLESSASFGQ